MEQDNDSLIHPMDLTCSKQLHFVPPRVSYSNHLANTSLGKLRHGGSC